MLILAREFASNLATPIYIADADDRLVYFNEPAERSPAGPRRNREIPVQEFSYMLAPQAVDGEPLRREDTPGGIAFTERRPAHDSLCVTGLDGVRRDIATTAFPLFGPDDEFHGIMVIFWEG